MKKIILYFFQSLIIYLSFILIKIIGLKYSRSIFSFIFKKLGPMVRSKNTINSNIERAFKNIQPKEKEVIEESMWSNYGKTFVEYFFLSKFRMQKTHINVKGLEILDKIKKENKPVIFISGHFANFELMSMELTKYNINLATIYRPLNNFFINWFMEFLRKKNVCKNQIKKGIKGVKKSLIFLEKNYSLALMIDQRLSEGELIDFFNHPAYTTTLPAQLAIKFNLKIVPIFIKRKEDDTFEMNILEPVLVHRNKMETTKQLNDILESMIVKNPGQWIWTHNRWK